MPTVAPPETDAMPLARYAAQAQKVVRNGKTDKRDAVVTAAHDSRSSCEGVTARPTRSNPQ